MMGWNVDTVEVIGLGIHTDRAMDADGAAVDAGWEGTP
jgi:hypothetical protein